MKNKNELIIVLVVIAAVIVLGIPILAGMLLPALNQAKEKAKQADCTSKLSQIGKASFQYAMSYDDWYPTSSRVSLFSAPKWMNGNSGTSFDLLRKQDLLTDPKGFLCPSKPGIVPASYGGDLQGHVSYNWCDGLMGGNATLSPIACDGLDNHARTGRFLRGDGSVGCANGSSSQKWTQNQSFKKDCHPNAVPNYSF